MHPRDELCHLLVEYNDAADAGEDDIALAIAMHVREAAQRLVIAAAQNVSPPYSPRQFELYFAEGPEQ